MVPTLQSVELTFKAEKTSHCKWNTEDKGVEFRKNNQEQKELEPKSAANVCLQIQT